MRIRLATAALIASLLIPGCVTPETGRSNEPVAAYDFRTDPAVNPGSLFEPFPANGSSVSTDDTLIIHALSEPESLNPLFATNGSTLNVVGMMFEHLVVRTSDMRFLLNDRLVESSEELDGGRRLRLVLLDGRTWHDGEAFDASDIEFSWKAILDPQVPAVYWKGRAERVDSIAATSKREVLIEFPEEPLAPALRMESLAFPIVPEHLLGRAEDRREDPTLRNSAAYNRFSRETPIGTGPFRFADWRANDQVVLERWADYPGPRVQYSFRRVIHKLVPDRNLALLEFMGGGLDAVYLTAQQAATQTQGEDFLSLGLKAMVEQQTHGHLRWNLNDRRGLFRDVRVRQAMAHSLDIERLIDEVSYGVHRRPVGFLDPNADFADPSLEPYEFDLDRAARLLDDAGWLVSEDDGWRYKAGSNGEPIRCAFQVATFQAFRDLPLIANLWQQDLRRIGVDLSYRVYERGAFAALRAEGDFDVIADYAGNGNDADQWTPLLVTNGARNWGGYSNPELDDLFERGAKEQDLELRRELYRQAHRLEHEDPAILPIWCFRVFVGLHERLHGVELSPSGPYGIAGQPPAGWESPIGPGWWVRRGEEQKR